MLIAMTESNHADAPQPEPERPAEFPLQSDQPTVQTPRSDLPSEPAYSSPAQPPSGEQPSYSQSEQPSYAQTQGYSSAPDYSASQPGGPYAGYQQPGFHTEPLPPSSPAFGPYTPPATKPPKHRQMRTIFVAAVTAALVGAGVGAGTVALIDDNNSNGTVVSSLSTTTASAPVTAKTDGTVAGAAAKIQPSVVTISVSGSQESGTGTGVIIRSDGYILTNNHVVSVAGSGGSIKVLTDDGRQATAKIVGTDEPDDLAVIKVDGLSNLTAATFAKSSNLVVGQTVVAVGAPLGLSNTVTSGIVSNTARPVRAGDNDQSVFNAVQTDAAINPGNSGGPLVDLNGNVVGINAAIATANSGGLQIPGQSQQSGSIGIGFAIPSDEAGRIANELISTGKATHAVIGVQVNASSNGQSSNGQSSNGQSTNGTLGATLSSVQSGTPAAKAGLRAGDVITKVGQQRIEDADGLIAAVRSHAPNDKVTLTYTRDGKTNTVEVTLGSSTN
jgi:putative serine protease PepD